MPNHLTSSELNALLQIIGIATNKGIFNGPDLPTVGALWSRLTFVHAVAVDAEAAEAATQDTEDKQLG